MDSSVGQKYSGVECRTAEQQNSIAECSALVAACTTDKMRKCNQSHKVYLSRVHLLPFYNLFSACLHAFP
jgi:uncharacterized coiled-coil protein SlyX